MDGKRHIERRKTQREKREMCGGSYVVMMAELRPNMTFFEMKKTVLCADVEGETQFKK
jgi:hypothetical protein